MAEQKKEVKTYIVDYICDECGVGKMRNSGMSHVTHPKQYPHSCTNCYYQKTFNCVYPRTEISKGNDYE